MTPHTHTEPDADRVRVYATGPLFLHCCAPIGMQREVVELQAGRRWRIYADPMRCSHDNGRQHWLLTEVRT